MRLLLPTTDLTLNAVAVAATGPLQLFFINVIVTLAGRIVPLGKPEPVRLTLVTPATPVLGAAATLSVTVVAQDECEISISKQAESTPGILT